MIGAAVGAVAGAGVAAGAAVTLKGIIGIAGPVLGIFSAVALTSSAGMAVGSQIGEAVGHVIYAAIAYSPSPLMFGG